jgi:hypothetical protein
LLGEKARDAHTGDDAEARPLVEQQRRDRDLGGDAGTSNPVNEQSGFVLRPGRAPEDSGQDFVAVEWTRGKEVDGSDGNIEERECHDELLETDGQRQGGNSDQRQGQKHRCFWPSHSHFRLISSARVVAFEPSCCTDPDE